MQATTLTLVSRRYCHLCQDMELALAALAADLGVAVEVLDVDADAALEARYDELVPVLLHDGRELCHYFLDVAKVRDYLSEIG
ncbi:glutaredoxin family protein [Candidatus Accumulibacter sp. ACC003]|uniref:glutaredoxin family protein n=1 Tax=Candidatus Accumulibacter sp. ACC003 TaxID=2823334 RepID=UPI0025C53547|nr:glutaredoxin family protein [Candidatus Accumulibacter sp. ACC003]